jgi:bile acid:Na+ symporter, BASS family
MLHTGLEVDRAHLKAVLKNWSLFGRALIANFIIIPIFGVLLSQAFHLSDPIATGFLLMAIAPGVPFLTLSGGRRKGGSLGFAAALALIMQALAIITVPITARFVLPLNDGLHVPVGSLIGTLLLVQLVPLLLAMVLAERMPAAAARLEGPFMFVVAACIVALLVLLAPTIAKSVASVYGSNGLLAMLAMVVLSIATGWVFGGAERAHRRTLAIATALRNIALAALVATTAFPGSDAAAAVVTYFLIQVIVTMLVGTYFTRTAQPSVASSR